MSLTYLGHSAFRFEVDGLSIYVDPYFRDPVDWKSLPKGDIVIYSHGHFDHGVLAAPQLYQAWKCQFLSTRSLIAWMHKKYKKIIPYSALNAVNQNESASINGLTISAIPTHHPLNRLGKTILTLFARSSAPGKPVNGYHFGGYYHSGDTMYTPAIAQALKGLEVHTACLPIGGKYAIASPQEALHLAEEIGAERIVPMHWQPLLQQVHFRYQPSDLVRLAKLKKSSIEICALAIGERLEAAHAGRK